MASKNYQLILFGLFYSFVLISGLSDPYYYETSSSNDPYYDINYAYAPSSYVPQNDYSPTVVSTQYHSQDEYGNADFGYANENSALKESRDEYGRVVGSYSYVDANGYTRHTSYVADDAGFRITSTNNLPIDTPEVAYAKARHLDALKERGFLLQ